MTAKIPEEVLEKMNKEFWIENLTGADIEGRFIRLLSSLGYEIVKTGGIYLTEEQAERLGWELWKHGYLMFPSSYSEEKVEAEYFKPQFLKLLEEIKGESK